MAIGIISRFTDLASNSADTKASSLRIFLVLFMFTLALAIFPGAEAANINSCQDITAPGTYYINDSITYDGSTTACLNITVSDVKIDGYGGYNITGSGNGTGIIIDGSFENITIQGVEIYNVATGIDLENTNITGFSIVDNVIEATDYGVYAYVQDICSNLVDEDYTIGDMIITDNEITTSTGSSQAGIYFMVQRLGYDLENSNCSVGRIEVDANVIDSEDGIYLSGPGYLGSIMSDNSNFDIDYIEMRYNDITANSDGIIIDNPIYMWGYNINDSTFYAGRADFSDNTIDAPNGYALNVGDNLFYYVGRDMINSSFTMDDVMFNDNIIDSADVGIATYADVHFIGYNMSNSHFRMGNIEILGNDITMDASGTYGIYIYNNLLRYAGNYLYGASTFTAGNIAINENEITGSGSNYGIYIEKELLENVCNYLYEGSSCDINNVLINDNIIDDVNYGIYAEYLITYFGYELYDSSAIMDDFEIKRNDIYSSNNYALFVNNYVVTDSAYVMNNSNFTTGDIEISSNTLHSDDDYGLGLYVILETVGYNLNSSNVTFGTVAVNSNIIDTPSGSYGIYVYSVFEDVGYNLHSNSDMLMGDVQINNNTIDVTGFGEGIYFEEYVFGDTAHEIYDSAFTMGNFQVNNNNITSEYNGIDIDDSLYYYLGTSLYNSSFSMGHIQFNDNEIVTINGDAIYFDTDWDHDYFVCDLYNSDAVVGNIEIMRNNINSSDEGIYINYLLYDTAYDIYDYSTCTIGDVKISENVIYSNTSYGLDVYELIYTAAYDIGNHSTVELGDVLINSNVIESADYAIYITYMLEDVAGNVADSSVTIGNAEINGNTLTASRSTAIDLGDGVFYEMMEYLDNASVTVGHAQINNNNITDSTTGIDTYGLYGIGYELAGNSTATMGDFEIDGNTIVASSLGINLEYLSYQTGYNMYNTSSLTIGNISIDGNTITSSGGDGINVDSYLFGEAMYNDSTFTIGDISIGLNTITADADGINMVLRDLWGTPYDNAVLTHGLMMVLLNNITASNDGIYIESLDFGLVSGNTIEDGGYGIYLVSADNNTIYDNYFNNTVNAFDNGTNIWNIAKTLGTNIIDGPYLGGNFWSDYTGSDTDNDGLGDTNLPYDSNGNITNGGDSEPLVEYEAGEPEEPAGGGTGTGAQTYEFTGGIQTYTMDVNARINFYYKNLAHMLKILGIGNGYVNFILSSEPQEFTLVPGQSKQLDVDGDGANDMIATLLSITPDLKKADVQLKWVSSELPTTKPVEGISEVPTEEGKPAVTPGPTGETNLYIVAVIALITIVAVFYYTRKKRR